MKKLLMSARAHLVDTLNHLTQDPCIRKEDGEDTSKSYSISDFLFVGSYPVSYCPRFYYFRT